MAVFKCKMCGGALDIVANDTVATCEYCGTQQTVALIDDEKKVTLFNRANHLRMACEFDKAAGVYESIISEFPYEAEAYWGNILCKYGIEYVDDPKTGKKIPTCHRSSFDCVFDDKDFDLVMEYAEISSRKLYREEAKAIEQLRKDIIAVSSKEEPYDIFICYKETDENGGRTVDSLIAQDTYNALTKEGYRVFFSRISLEDKIGQEYEPYIFAALSSAKIMLVFGTDYEYFNAVWVKNEWSRYLQLIENGEKKTIVPCFKGIDAYDMPKEFARLQAQDMGKVGAIQDLLRGVEKLIGTKNQATPVAPQSTQPIGASATQPLLKRAMIFLDDGDFNSANEYAEKVLDIDPECGEAYLIKLMAETKSRKREELKNLPQSFEGSINYQKIMRFGDDALKNEIRSYIDFILERNETVRKDGIYQRALVEKGKNTPSSYDEAMKLLSSIKGYKDSTELIEEYNDKKIKIETDVLSAIKKKEYEVLQKNAIKQIEQNKDNLRRLSELKNSFHLIVDAIAVLDAQEQEMKKEIGQLEDEVKSLGLFAGKQKKEIQSKIEELLKKVNTISVQRMNKTEHLMGCKTIEEIAQKEAIINKNIEIAESNGQMYESNMTFEQAFEMCKCDNYLRQMVLKICPTYELFNADVGSTVRFGFYRSTAIDWIVLAKEENRLLVISKYALDCKQYNIKFTPVTWETCTVRKWLNNDFINATFSKEEKAMIQTVTVLADMNPEYSTNPGNATRDKVFLLSIAEVEKYFTTDEAKKCVPTAYAITQGAFTSDNYTLGDKFTCWWWLRSPGDEQCSAISVHNDGTVNSVGTGVNFERACVRPAMWIAL